MHASVCMQATCMCTCVSGHTLPCMSVHRYACRYTHELPNASMIVLCIYTHMSAHIAMYGCTHAGTHSVHICSGMHMHRYGARGKTVQHSSPGSFTSSSGDLALSHSCLPGGLFGPLSGGAQVVRCQHMSSGSGPSCSKMLFPCLCRFPVTQGAQCQSDCLSCVSNLFLNEAWKISLPVGFRSLTRMGLGGAYLGLLPGACWG